MIVRIEAKTVCRAHTALVATVVLPDDSAADVVADRVRLAVANLRERSRVEHVAGRTDCQSNHGSGPAGALTTRIRAPCFDCYRLCDGCDGGGP